MGLESNFQSTVLEYLNNTPGCVAENVSGNAKQSGRPDVNGCFHGRMFKLELKTPDHGYKASKKQELNLRRWKRAGCVTGVIYSMSTLRTLISMHPWKDNPGKYEFSEATGGISWFDIPKLEE